MKRSPFKENKHLLPPDALVKIGVLKKLATNITRSDLNKYIKVSNDLWRFLQPGESVYLTIEERTRESYIVENRIGINNTLILCKNIHEPESIFEQDLSEVTAIHTKFNVQSIMMIRIYKNFKDNTDERLQKMEKDINRIKELLKK